MPRSTRSASRSFSVASWRPASLSATSASSTRSFGIHGPRRTAKRQGSMCGRGPGTAVCESSSQLGPTTSTRPKSSVTSSITTWVAKTYRCKASGSDSDQLGLRSAAAACHRSPALHGNDHRPWAVIRAVVARDAWLDSSNDSSRRIPDDKKLRGTLGACEVRAFPDPSDLRRGSQVSLHSRWIGSLQRERRRASSISSSRPFVIPPPGSWSSSRAHLSVSPIVRLSGENSNPAAIARSESTVAKPGWSRGRTAALLGRGSRRPPSEPVREPIRAGNHSRQPRTQLSRKSLQLSASFRGPVALKHRATSPRLP